MPVTSHCIRIATVSMIIINVRRIAGIIVTKNTWNPAEVTYIE